jgi:beta-xylosidase
MSQIQGINAILAGDYPDPSIVRVGRHYYMTHSSFHYTPGLLMWHSHNLIDWEPIGHAIHEHVGGSIMAPDLIYYEGLYYIYFPAGGTNWVVTAENPAGPWSNPIDLKIGYIDPGHAADQEGNRYLFLSEGFMVQLTKDGLSTVGELRKVYEGWRYPKEWLTEGFYLESPKLTYKDGYYYMTSAQGGTAGPATSHMIVSARSKSLEGPWENSPYNPIVRTKHRSETWWSKGHGTLVDTRLQWRNSAASPH